jgi:hypothetical protein
MIFEKLNEPLPDHPGRTQNPNLLPHLKPSSETLRAARRKNTAQL